MPNGRAVCSEEKKVGNWVRASQVLQATVGARRMLDIWANALGR